jgi:hypothetical protein
MPRPGHPRLSAAPALPWGEGPAFRRALDVRPHHLRELPWSGHT